MLHAMILAGGSGTRFWPKSRRLRPKQLLAFGGERTLLEEACARVETLVPAVHTWVVANAEHRNAIMKLLPRIPPVQIIGEPTAQDTAAAIGFGNLLIRARDPDATVLVMPSDHKISPVEKWAASVRVAAEMVARRPHTIAVFGIRARTAATGFGYIERGGALGEPSTCPVHEVAGFHEKPDSDTAERFVREGRLWNSGMFCFRGAALDAQLEQHLPELHRGLRQIASHLGARDFDAEAARLYPTLPRISIDRGVLMKCRDRIVICVDYEWDDVGTWGALARHVAADARGNHVAGDCASIDSSDNLVDAGDGVVALCGVEGLVVVHTADATLVCKREDAERVKELLERVRELPRGEKYL